MSIDEYGNLEEQSQKRGELRNKLGLNVI